MKRYRYAYNTECIFCFNSIIHFFDSLHSDFKRHRREGFHRNALTPHKGWCNSMNCLKGPVKSRRRTVTIFQGHINNFCIAALQVHCSQRHSSPPDILRQRNICHIRKHPLKMISRTAGYFCKFLIINLIGQMLFNVVYRFI